MARSVREVFDESEAAGRLRVPVAAWRWATGSGLVPAADVGPGRWSRELVEAADPEAVRAALRGQVGAGWAADRLTEALGTPLRRCRPRVTAAAVGHLVRAGLLVYLGGEVAFSDVHPDQVNTLARRRDLPALLDRHVPLGPDQAARRLGVRRGDFDAAVRLGFLSPVGTVEVDYKSHGGWTTVPLYSAQDVALLPVVRPLVDWQAVATVRPGRRSPLAALTLVVPGEDRVLLAEVGRIAGVGRAAAANWRRRHDDFPAPVGGTETSPEFDRAAVVAWLLVHGKIAVPTETPSAALAVADGKGGTRRFRLEDPPAPGQRRRRRGPPVRLDHRRRRRHPRHPGRRHVRPDRQVPGRAQDAAPGRPRRGTRGRPVPVGYGRLAPDDRVAGLRGTPASGPVGGLLRHGPAYAGPGAACVCRRHDCGGAVPVSWCAEHGDAVGPAL
ncbi:hypothetical protein [Streptomyces virginiae]|uniref:hypothetical protein n=1 Tax=Streptomyces virginiae TaxID=1961 RepID=UPI003432E137